MPNTPPRLVAGGNINPCRFVKMSTAADDRCLECDANEAPIGISYPEGRYAPQSDIVVTNYHAIAGDSVGLYGDGDQCLLELGSGGATRGGRLKADADGKGVAIATTGTTIQNFGAIALESGSENEKIRVFVLLGSERPSYS